MKKQMLSLGLCGALLLMTGLTATAASVAGEKAFDGPRGGQKAECRMGMNRDHLGLMTGKLGLNAEQQEEVRKLLDAKREQADARRKQMADIRGQLRQAMNPKTFDEKVVRQLAAEKAKIQTEMMVSRARTHSQIYALLTPDQKELADLARNLKQLKGDQPRGNRGCPNPMPCRGPSGGK